MNTYLIFVKSCFWCKQLDPIFQESNKYDHNLQNNVIGNAEIYWAFRKLQFFKLQVLNYQGYIFTHYFALRDHTVHTFGSPSAKGSTQCCYTVGPGSTPSLGWWGGGRGSALVKDGDAGQRLHRPLTQPDQGCKNW